MRGRIIVVDDEPDTASVIVELLERRGFTAEAVQGGDECLERMSLMPADVVVTDLMMPGMSGLTLCTTLRTAFPDTVTIVLTARAELDLAATAIGAGAFDYITKPVKMQAIENAITRALVHIEQRRELRVPGG